MMTSVGFRVSFLEQKYYSQLFDSYTIVRFNLAVTQIYISENKKYPKPTYMYDSVDKYADWLNSLLLIAPLYFCRKCQKRSSA